MPIAVITPSHFQDSSQPYYQILTSAGFEVRFSDNTVPMEQKDALVSQLQGADAVLASTEPYTDEIFSQLKLRIVSRAGVGYDSVDLKAATAHNVAVTITPGTVHHSVAEQALALLFGIYRNVIQRDCMVRAGGWERESFPRLAGKSLGLIGLGVIGKCFAEKAKLLGLHVMAADPQLSEEEASSLGVQLVSFDELLETADIVSLHAPNIPATHHLMNASAFQKMKQDSVFLNTARGPLVDEGALFETLKSGKLMGAGLDVFEQEPPPIDHPLLTLDNVIVAPHMSGLDLQSEIDMASTAAQNIVDLYQNSGLHPNIINRDLPDDWTW
ncbi:MAG: phosphoglycerate dehydrogenase [Pirellulales bacterium]